MRVAIDAWALGTGGGVRRYLRSLLSAMAEREPAVEWSLYGGGPRPEGLPDRIRWLGGRRAWGRLWWEQIRCRRAYAADRADLAHHPKGNAPLGRSRVPLVVTVHDLLPVTHPSTETPAARLYWRLQLAGMRGVARVIAVSGYSRASFLSRVDFPADRAHVVHNGCAPQFRPQAAGEVDRVRKKHGLQGPYLLTVATLQPRKNHEAVIAAFDRLRRRGYAGTLVVVGRRGWKCGGEAGLPASSAIRRLGFVAEEDLSALYSGADLFLYPSWAEGFGFPPLEALACGAPVVASRSGALAETLGEGALWADPASPAEILGAADRLLSDAALRSRLRRAGFLASGRFTWEEAARKTLEVYRLALG